jgi:YuzL-like protein
MEVITMRRKRNPSKGAVSAASVQGNAGHGDQKQEKGKQSNNQQYGRENMGQ